MLSFDTYDGICKITIEMVNAVPKVTDEKDYDMFVKVEASKLSMNDEFMQYTPKTDKEREFKFQLEKAIKRGGLKDFKRPKYDPSFNQDGKGGICYESGKNHAVGKSYNWWNQVAKEFKPECNSRLGTKTEYIAFLGVLIKKMVENGWSVKNSWNAVCNDSKKLGNYWNSANGKHELEITGSREICGFYDLANCYKILAEDAEDKEAGGFWIASGNCKVISNFVSLADLYFFDFKNYDYFYSVGWLVLD